MSRSLKKGLAGEGYIADVVHDSDAAMSLVSGGNYDLILLDWMIPGAHDGPSLIRTWREAHEQAPILLLTARTTIGDRVNYLTVHVVADAAVVEDVASSEHAGDDGRLPADV